MAVMSTTIAMSLSRPAVTPSVSFSAGAHGSAGVQLVRVTRSSSQQKVEDVFRSRESFAQRRAHPRLLSLASVQRRGVVCAVTESPSTSGATDFRSKSVEDISVLVVGATGYIGKFVVQELVQRGYKVIAVAREKSGVQGEQDAEATKEALAGAQVVFGDVTNQESLASALKGTPVDVVVSCLASRTGGVKDSWLIDYEASKNALNVGAAAGASHYVLLSAICVQKPLLEFQRAKLKLEADLVEAEKTRGITYSIVRPTAFFKSLGGQVEVVKGGGPYVMFGDGKLCACKPISEANLASFIADCILEKDKLNKFLPIGGPGKAVTPLEQGEMLFQIVGKDPKFIKVPIEIMDAVIWLLDQLKKPFPNLEDAAEFGKIGRYYAAESMLIVDPATGKYSDEQTPSYGSDTLEDFFKKAVRDGLKGQELGDQALNLFN